jgi:hypothetical protein
MLMPKSITGNYKPRGLCETEAAEKFYKEDQPEEKKCCVCVRLFYRLDARAFQLTGVNFSDNKGRIKRRREE